MFTGLTQPVPQDGTRWARTALFIVYTPCTERRSTLCGPVVMLGTAHQVWHYTRQDLYVQPNYGARSDLCIHFCLSYRQWIMHLYLINSSGRQQNVLHIIEPHMSVSIIRHANRTYGIYGLSGSAVFVIWHKQCGFGGKMYLTWNMCFYSLNITLPTNALIVCHLF